MARVLLNGRVPLERELAAIEHGRQCERERDLQLLAGVLTGEPVRAPRPPGRTMDDILIARGEL